MRVKFLRSGSIRNVAKVRARALQRIGIAVPVESQEYATRDMRAASMPVVSSPAPTPVSPHAAEPGPAVDIQLLRRDYEELIGKRPYMGWTEAVLRQKIDEALNA